MKMKKNENRGNNEQSVIEHLEELRSKAIICIVAVLICSALAFPFSDDFIKKMEYDLIEKNSINKINSTGSCESEIQSSGVIVTNPMEGVITLFKVSVFLGFYFSIPILMYQFFSFVLPALYSRERKSFIIILPSSYILFTAGALFTYFIILPIMMKFFIAFSEPVAASLFKLSELVGFVVMMMLVMGIIFQWPLVTSVLSSFGILSPEFLSEKRRYAIVICFIIGAFMTDPTFITQILLAVPMILLYEIGILTSRLTWRE